MSGKNKNAESSYNGKPQFDDFKAGFKRLGLSDDAYRRLYEHLSEDEAKMAARYCETKDVRFDIFAFWDMPLARGLFPTKLSREIRLSGDGNAIKAYLDQNENDLCGKGDYAAAVP